jgi:hypothetical protein
MFMMYVMTCIIWIEGSRYDGGETKCGIHKPDLYFDTLQDCKLNIGRYEEYVIKSIYDQFEPPQDIVIKTECFKEKME